MVVDSHGGEDVHFAFFSGNSRSKVTDMTGYGLNVAIVLSSIESFLSASIS
jgi:hypothetical protein